MVNVVMLPVQVSELDGRALLGCLRDPAHSLTRITLDSTDFRCFQGSDNALVGMATNRPQRVLVARLTEEALVVVMGSSSGQGSFLYELQHNLLERSRRHMVGVPQPRENGAAAGAREGTGGQHAMRQKRLISPPPSSRASDGVSQDQVLVQLHH